MALAMDTRTVHWNAVGGGVKVGDKLALPATGVSGGNGGGAGGSSGKDDKKRRVVVDVREFRSSLPSFLHGSGLHIDACTLLVRVLIQSSRLDLRAILLLVFQSASFNECYDSCINMI